MEKTLLPSILSLVTVISLLLSAGISIAANSGDPKLERAIKKANAEWAGAMKTGDAAVIAAPYTDNAVFVGIDGACVQGKNEIEKLYRARFESAGFATSTSIRSKSLLLDGDLAYESGDAQVGFLKDGKATVSGGRFLTVWQRQPDGGWKIVRNIVLP